MVTIVIQKESEACEEGKARMMQRVAYNKEILALNVEEWGHSSVVEHSTADQSRLPPLLLVKKFSCKRRAVNRTYQIQLLFFV